MADDRSDDLPRHPIAEETVRKLALSMVAARAGQPVTQENLLALVSWAQAIYQFHAVLEAALRREVVLDWDAEGKTVRAQKASELSAAIQELLRREFEKIDKGE